MSNGQLNSPPVSNAKPKKAESSSANQESNDEEEYVEAPRKSQLLAMAPSWLFSFVSHLILILALAFWFLPLAADSEIAFTSGTESGVLDDSLDLDVDSFEDESQEELDTQAIETDIQNELITETSIAELPTTELSDVGTLFSSEAIATPTEVVINSSSGNELSGRSADSRKQLAKKNGASGESEEAVDLALKWIVKHQLSDGSWSFDHTLGEGAFRDTPGPGLMANAKIGATAMALLPLLGAGHTHISGEHKAAVKKGFEFLKRAGNRRSTDVISYSEPDGRLYSHGLATIALCECYAMTYDKLLEPYAQGAINFTIYAQDSRGGGWRYKPKEPGDTCLLYTSPSPRDS